MSATVKEKRPTAQQRGARASKRLLELLGLNDAKLLGAALAEVAVIEAERNRDFADTIRQVYQELASLKSPSRSRRVDDDVELVPIITIEGLRSDPFAPLDPYFLYKVYGGAQLRAALRRYSLDRLKGGAAAVEKQNPGTKPKNRGRIEDVIDYIVEKVAGPGY